MCARPEAKKYSQATTAVDTESLRGRRVKGGCAAVVEPHGGRRSGLG